MTDVVERWALPSRYVVQKCGRDTCVTAEEQCLKVGRGENRHLYRSYTYSRALIKPRFEVVIT